MGLSTTSEKILAEQRKIQVQATLPGKPVCMPQIAPSQLLVPVWIK